MSYMIFYRCCRGTQTKPLSLLLPFFVILYSITINNRLNRGHLCQVYVKNYREVHESSRISTVKSSQKVVKPGEWSGTFTMALLNLYFKRDGASIIEFHRIGMSEKNLLGIMAQNQIPVVSQLWGFRFYLDITQWRKVPGNTDSIIQHDTDAVHAVTGSMDYLPMDSKTLKEWTAFTNSDNLCRSYVNRIWSNPLFPTLDISLLDIDQNKRYAHIHQVSNQSHMVRMEMCSQDKWNVTYLKTMALNLFEKCAHGSGHVSVNQEVSLLSSDEISLRIPVP